MKTVGRFFAQKRVLLSVMLLAIFAFGSLTFLSAEEPYTAELSYVEYSAAGLQGSVMPASCASRPATNHFVGDCWRITMCRGTLPANAQSLSPLDPWGRDRDYSTNRWRPMAYNWVYRTTDTTRPCEFNCRSGYTWNGSTCLQPPVCTGAVPTGATLYSGDDTGFHGAVALQRSNTNTARKCEWNCDGGSVWDGSACATPPICTGILPAGAAIYSGDTSGFTGSVSLQYASTDTARKCEWSCSGGQVWTGTACVTPSGGGGGHSCTGDLPSNAEIYAGDVSGLSTDTTLQYASTDTARKCEFGCTGGRVWDGTACALPVGSYRCTGTFIPGLMIPSSGTESTGLTSNEAWQYAAANTARKCEFSCGASFTWNGSTCEPNPVTSGDISGSGCEIAADDSTCQARITWDIQHATYPFVYNDTTSQYCSQGVAQRTNQSCTIDYGSNLIRAFAGTSDTSLPGIPYGSVSVTATCPAGSPWNGSICRTPKPNLVPAVENSEIYAKPDGTGALFDPATGYYYELAIRYRVVNSGDGDAGPTVTGFRMDLNDDGAIEDTRTDNTSAIAAGTVPSYREFVIGTNVQPGDYEVTVEADANDDEDEGVNEGDNELTITDNFTYPDPGIELEVNPSLVRPGDDTVITWDTNATYDLNCELRGPGLSTPHSFNPNTSGVPTGSLSNVGPITAKSEYRLECTAPDGTTFSATAAVETTGTLEEV